jgi:hypothetical protein
MTDTHNKTVLRMKEAILEKFGKEAKFMPLDLIPDAIVVDFENKAIYAVEVSFHDERFKKMLNYGSKDRFENVIFVKVRNYFDESLKPKIRIENVKIWKRKARV